MGGSRNEEDTTTPTTTTNPNIAYTYVESSDICDLMAGYWNCICELLVTEEKEGTTQHGVNTIVLAYPPPPQAATMTRVADASSTSEQQLKQEQDQQYYHERFIGITKL